MAIVLFDNALRKNLFPLTRTCAVADLLIGIFTIKQRWERLLKQEAYIHTENYLQPLYPIIPDGCHIWIDASVIANDILIDRIYSLQEGKALADSHGLIAGKLNNAKHKFSTPVSLQLFETIFEIDEVRRLRYPWQIFQWNDEILRKDFAIINKNGVSCKIPASNQVTAPENIFIEKGARLEFTNINASSGPVYIGENAEVMEGAMIRGSFAALKNSVVKMSATIYGATTIGLFCTAGGEIKNTVMQAFSNKAHLGYLGDSVIGKWCNLGAGTSNSNLKNNAGDIIFNLEDDEQGINAGNKCGVIMGDFSRTAINTSINTGSLIGVSCNVFGEGLTPKTISDFQWGTKGVTRYEFEKAMIDIDVWKKMKQQNLSDAEINILKYIFEQL